MALGYRSPFSFCRREVGQWECPSHFCKTRGLYNFLSVSYDILQCQTPTTETTQKSSLLLPPSSIRIHHSPVYVCPSILQRDLITFPNRLIFLVVLFVNQLIVDVSDTVPIGEFPYIRFPMPIGSLFKKFVFCLGKQDTRGSGNAASILEIAVPALQLSTSCIGRFRMVDSPIPNLRSRS